MVVVVVVVEEVGAEAEVACVDVEREADTVVDSEVGGEVEMG